MKCVQCNKPIGMTEYCSAIAGDGHCSEKCLKEHEAEKIAKRDKKKK